MGTDKGNKSFLTSLFPIKAMIVILLINAVVSTATVYVYDRYFALKIKAFDMRGFMARQKTEFYGGKITEDELLGSLNRLDDMLKKEKKNTVILNSDAVMKNGQFIQPSN